jgi:hypothetical protein
MSNDTRLKVAYGRQTFPETARAVWGARLIWPDDLLPDRQDLAAHSDEDKQALVAWLNGKDLGTGAISKMRDALSAPYSLGLTPNGDEEAVIYEDSEGIIVGSAQSSHGYVYVAGWLKA